MQHAIMEIIHQFGAFGLGLLLAGGIIGLPVPDETLLVLSGYSMDRGHMPILGTVLAAYLGSYFGVTVSYLLGAKIGMPLLHRAAPKLRIPEKRIIQAEAGFNRYGKVVLLIGYYIPGLRQLSAFFAGVSQMPLRTFALYAYGGATIWVSLFLGAGYFLGRHFSIEEMIESFLGNPRLFEDVTSITAGILLILVLRTYWANRQVPDTQKDSLPF